MTSFFQKYRILIVLFSLLFFQKNVQAQSTCIGTQGTVDWLIWENIAYGELIYLYQRHSYPSSPDKTRTVTTLATPRNYTNYYAGVIRGYILAPETGTYTFNVTGDDQSRFYLSTNEMPANMSLVCEVPEWSGEEEHDKFVEQTSAPINLVAGNYYYFEARYAEGTGGDFIRVHWRLPSAPTADWEIIHGTHLYAHTCDQPCPLVGTPCDDGNPNTTDDQEDGNCNCTGTPASTPSCVGERANILALYYDNISGSDVNSMYNDPSFPNAPTRGEYLDYFYLAPTDGVYDAFGTQVKAYLRAPATGDYTFGVTGDNQVSLRLSTDTDPANATEIAWTWWSWFGDLYNVPEQVSNTITLQEGDFYYIEMNHKDNSGGEFFAVYWKTPISQDTFFQHLSPTYLYEYTCHTACMPEGLTCDDGDSSTFGDAFDTNCMCVGTPCADPACTNALDYTPNETCGTTNEHSNYEGDAWLSCQTSPSPNPFRGNSHWIQYDLGAHYIIDSAHVWNYNVAGATQQGFQQVAIDYSANGTTWQTLGTFTWSEASGNANYTGFPMNQFNGIAARYILITGLSNFDGSGCMGFSELRVAAASCPTAGTPCDDGNPQTINDQYDAYCHCAGAALVENTCTDPVLVIDDIPVVSDNYDAIQTVFSAGLVPDGAVVSYIAGTSINLEAGFEVELGADFLADIIECPENSTPTLPEAPDAWIQLERKDDMQVLHYQIPQGGRVQIDLHHLDGTHYLQLQDTPLEAGIYEKNIHIPSLESGVYLLVLKTPTTQWSERIVVATLD